MLNIANRNIKLFFRDKMSVFFSLMSVLIVIGLYVLFLGDVLMSDMETYEGARFLMDSWIMSGVIAVCSFTTTLGAFGVIINDRETKKLKDFIAAPIKRSTLAGGYIISSCFIGFITSIITFILAEIYIVAYGGELLPFLSMIKILGLIILSVIASSSMIFLLVSFLKSNNAFATASSIIGTLIGFLTGIYIPIGTLPSGVQTVVRFFPVSHSAVLLRQTMMEVPMEASFANAPKKFVTEFKENLGVVLRYGDYTADTTVHILVLVATIIVFYGLAILNLSRKEK